MTSGHHRVVRLQLALIPLYVWSLYIWSVTIRQLPLARFAATASVFRDFAHFYVLGGIARDKTLDALYSVSAQRALVERLVPSAIETVFPPSYGPQVALLFAPFARLAYVPALLTWLAVTAVLYALAGWTLWRSCKLRLCLSA